MVSRAQVYVGGKDSLISYSAWGSLQVKLKMTFGWEGKGNYMNTLPDMLTTLFGILVARESWFRMLWIERLGDLEFEFESRAEPFWLSCLAFSGSEAVPWGLVLLLFWSLWSSQLVSRFTSLSFYASDATRALVCEQRWSKLLISPHKLVDSFCCFGLFEFTVGLGAFLSIHCAWPLAWTSPCVCLYVWSSKLKFCRLADSSLHEWRFWL